MINCSDNGSLIGGKHNGELVSDLFETDPEYLWWLKTNADICDTLFEILTDMKEPEIMLWFGRHKGKTLRTIKSIDPQYISFMKAKLNIKDTRLLRELNSIT